jgi:hypothetical protein
MTTVASDIKTEIIGEVKMLFIGSGRKRRVYQEWPVHPVLFFIVGDGITLQVIFLPAGIITGIAIKKCLDV